MDSLVGLGLGLYSFHMHYTWLFSALVLTEHYGTLPVTDKLAIRLHL